MPPLSESVAYEWPSLKQGGVVRYTYPSDKRPDTSADLLSLGFITPSIDAVLARVDGHPAIGGGGANGLQQGTVLGPEKKDFLEIQIVSQTFNLYIVCTISRYRG